ncbi:TfoX/Sxy family protein [Lysobacter solisilvae (ex Woo and Kim 2020)]|uniref:TfoX/Sxy family protein n=1 Tax=Agrilutibacter terrestris TaxID=2865112 RepID=A0A7H0FVE4_9GAMM|nr:TfoX/Sxy family protein [Lysobacter terrestris]QNP40010.1 TfoX/Sxy family protein [Lysobacter terrestris]
MSQALIEHLRDLFAPLGPISARAMFGGYGLYFDGMIIGVILDEVPYFKTDELTRGDFEAAGCEPAVYDMKGTPLQMSYWSLPDEAMDSPQAMRPWALRAIEAARRKPVKPRRKRPS